jgi:hypothetical protein
MKKTINKLTKKNNKKTTYEPIRIIKQPNTNLTKGKPEKKESNFKKIENINIKMGETQANLDGPHKPSLI